MRKGRSGGKGGKLVVLLAGRGKDRHGVREGDWEFFPYLNPKYISALKNNISGRERERERERERKEGHWIMVQ